MPLELVTTTQQYKSQFAASLTQTNIVANTNESFSFSLRKEDVSLDQVRKELNYQPSRLTAANASLTTTLQDIDEIRLYRTRKEKPGHIPQPPLTQPPSSSSAMKTSVLGNADESEKNKEKGKGGRKLVGRAILREIEEMAELKDVEARKASNLQNDVAVQEMVAASNALSKAAYECRHMLIRNRFHNNHRIENVNTLNHIRRDYLKKNEKRREDISIYPKRLENHCKPNNVEESIDWALQTSEFYKDYVEEELFGMTVDGKNALFSSSSEEENEDDEDTNSKDNKSKKKKKKEEKEKLNPHSPLPPNNPLTRSPRMIRTPRSMTNNQNNTSPLLSQEKKETSPNKQKKSGKEPEMNILEVDMAAKLSGRLDALDKSLYREMIRQNKVIQMQNRNRSMLPHRRSSKRSSPNTSKSPTNKRNSNLNRRTRSGSTVGTLRTASRDTEAESDNNTADPLETSSNASTRKRTTTFEDTRSIPDSYYDSPLSRSTSASSVQSPKSSKKKSFSFGEKLKRGSKRSSSPPRESLKILNKQQKTEEGKVPTFLSSENNQIKEEQVEAVIVTSPTVDNEKEGNEEKPTNEEENKEEDEEDEEEDDDDEFDTTNVQPVLPPSMRKLLVSTYLQHSFLKAIPADPRATMLHKRPLTVEQQDELIQDRARKMAIVDSIVEELLLEQKEKFDPWHKAMTTLKDGDSNEREEKSKGKRKHSKNKSNKNIESDQGDKEGEEKEEKEEDEESINKYIVNYEAMFQDFDQTKLKPTNGTIYFVSSLDTTLTQDNTSGTDYSQLAVPFREGETKTAILRSKMKERHVAGYTLSSKQLVKQISPRKEGQKIVEEVQDYMKQYSILKQTKGIRTEVEESMKQLKETCLKKTHDIKDKALNLVNQWKLNNIEKEQLMKDEIQYLRDREFKVATVLRKRQKQFQKFDDRHASYLTYQIPDSQYSQDKLSEIGFQLDKKTSATTTHHKRGEKAGEGKSNKDTPVGNTFVTQMPQKPASSAPRVTVKQSPRRTMISNLATSATNNAAANPVAVVNLGGSAISDNKFTYAYANQLEIIIKQNEERERKEETHRIISKQWFVSLLQKLKRYKRSSSNRLPLSLFLLLSSLKKLIGLNIVITKEIVWTLIDRTIQPDEHKSDLVYSTLKLLFDAVQVTADDIYHRLKNKQIELSPKLLMQIQRERKLKQIKARILMANRMNAAHKDRSSFRSARRASSSRKTMLSKEEREDPAMSGLQGLRNARASVMHGVMDALGDVDLTEEDYAMLMEDEDAMKFFDSNDEEEDDDDNQKEKEKKEGLHLNHFQSIDIDKYFQSTA